MDVFVLSLMVVPSLLVSYGLLHDVARAYAINKRRKAARETFRKLYANIGGVNK